MDYYPKIIVFFNNLRSKTTIAAIKDKLSINVKTNNEIYLYQSSRNYELFNPNLFKALSIIFIGLLFSFLVIASITHIKEAVIASGEIAPEDNIVVIRHFDGGLISKINVREGDVVTKGQVLLQIDGTGAKEDLNKVLELNIGLKLKEERLRSILNQEKPNFEQYTSDKNIIAEQLKIYNDMLSASAAEKTIIKNQIQQQEYALQLLTSKQEHYNHEINVASQIATMYSDLAKKNNTSKLQLLQVERDIITLTRDRDALIYDIKKAEQAIQEYKNRLLSFDATKRNTTNQEHEKLLDEIQQNDENIKKFAQKADRVEVRTPVSGITKAKFVNSIGETISPATNLFEIVPFDMPLIATIHISPNDIGTLKIGDVVRIKVSAFDYIKYGLITGSLYHLSGDTFKNDKNEPYYKGKVKLERNYFMLKDGKKYLMPGMLIKAEIETGDRTIMEYLLKPIYRSLDGGLVEH